MQALLWLKQQWPLATYIFALTAKYEESKTGKRENPFQKIAENLYNIDISETSADYEKHSQPAKDCKTAVVWSFFHRPYNFEMLMK